MACGIWDLATSPRVSPIVSFPACIAERVYDAWRRIGLRSQNNIHQACECRPVQVHCRSSPIRLKIACPLALRSLLMRSC